MFENYYAVIMAGGGGTRLWPLSRQNRPKQMLNLVGERSMFQLAVDRLVCGEEGEFLPPEQIFIVTVEEQAAALQQQYPEIPPRNYLLEPMPRGTASVVGLATIALQKHDPQAVMAVLTADHLIENVERFHQLLKLAYFVAQKDYLVTLGIQPTFPATGYGYIQVGGILNEVFEGSTLDLRVYQALKFKEKPDEAQAQVMLADGKHAWNSGMFVWKVEQVLGEFARQMPVLSSGLRQIAQDWGSPTQKETVSRVWQTLQPQTIDYGIMEGALKVAVIPAGGLDWTDIGSWDALFDVLPFDNDGNIVRNCQSMFLDTKDSLVFGTQNERLVVMMGVEDLVIVDTEDVLLVCRKDHAQKIRQVVNILKQTKPKYV